MAGTSLNLEYQKTLFSFQYEDPHKPCIKHLLAIKKSGHFYTKRQSPPNILLLSPDSLDRGIGGGGGWRTAAADKGSEPDL